MSVRAVRAFVLVVLCALATPAPAAAQFGRGWLERLSGPGPFRGPAFFFRPLCLAKTATTAERTAAQTRVVDRRKDSKLADWILPLRMGEGAPPFGWVTPVGCHFLDEPGERDARPAHVPRIEVGYEYSRLHSGANPLDYSESAPGAPPLDTRINLRTHMFTFDIRVTRVLDVGAALGWGTFSPEQEGLFKSFKRPIGQPMRLITRPLTVFSNSKRKTEWFLIQFDGTRFAGGFTDEDFGAIQGTYDEPGEMLWTWSIKADLTAFLWK